MPDANPLTPRSLADASASKRASNANEWFLRLAVVAVVVVVCWPFFKNPGAVVYSPSSDVLAQHHPFRHLLGESLRERSRIPLWNATSFGGMPLAGDPQAGLFYPFNWLHALLAPDDSGAMFGWVIVLHLIMGGWGMLWWLRDHSFSAPARLAGSVAFMLSGKWFFHVIYPGHTIFLPLMWLPWQCGWVDRIWRQPSIRKSVALALIAGLATLGYHPQLWFYSHLLLGVYALAVGCETPLVRWAKPIGCLVLSATLALGMSAVQILPALDLIRQDLFIRSAGMPYKHAADRSLGFDQLINFLIPAYGKPMNWESTAFVGVVALVLTIFAWTRRERRPLTLFLLCIVSVSIWYSLGSNGGLHRVMHDHVPGFKIFRIPTRILLQLGLPIGFLTAAGIAGLCEQPASRLRAILAVLFAIAAALVLYFYPNPDGCWAAAALAAPLACQFPWPMSVRPALAWGVALLVIADLMRFAIPMVDARPLASILGKNPIVEKLKGPIGRERVLVLDTSTAGMGTSLPVTYSSIAGIESLSGFNPLVPRSLFRYLRVGVLQMPLEWSYGTSIRVKEIHSRRHLDLLNVRWVVSNQPVEVDGLVLRSKYRDLPVYHFATNAGGINLLPETYLYENVHVLPRAALVRRAIVGARPSTESDTSDPVDRTIRQLSSIDPKREIIVNDPAFAGEFPGDYQSLDIHHEGDEIEISVDAGSGGYLFLSEMWYPGWNVFDGDAAVETFVADGIFMAVKLGPGQHEIRFRYRPRAYLWGRAITLLSLIACGFLCFRFK